MERQIVETDQYWWSRKLDGHFIRIQKQGDEWKFAKLQIVSIKVLTMCYI